MASLPIRDHGPPSWVAEVVTSDQLTLGRRLLWQRLIMQSGMATSRRAVGWALATRANGQLEAWPSFARLADDTGQGRSTVRASLAELRTVGWLIVEQPNKREPQILTLCWPASQPASMRGPEGAKSEHPGTRPRVPAAGTLEAARVPAASSEGASSEQRGCQQTAPEGEREGSKEGAESASEPVDLVDLAVSKLDPDHRSEELTAELAGIVAGLIADFGTSGARARLDAIADGQRWPSKLKWAARNAAVTVPSPSALDEALARAAHYAQAPTDSKRFDLEQIDDPEVARQAVERYDELVTARSAA